MNRITRTVAYLVVPLFLLNIYSPNLSNSYNASQQVIEPIGVGRVDNNKIVSVGSVNLTSLDFIGYAQVHPNLLQALISYAEGDISLQQLKAQLQAVLQEEG
ncbi:hypothetical protein [Colwellia sp. RSH04]|uniref:hypothetical protein n=1 Tax=Colwellia sp. RSH04 TaxID=2305464 RepID=UPI000E56A1EF|nr:hypothetical protein [Colwellia sp. RSH04]RHW74802.1 hypothetical protein D1094_16770 [Colwellia sp. RSH04]